MNDTDSNKSEGEAIPLNATQVVLAAQWLADRPGQSLPIPTLQQEFGLTMREACDAFKLAHRFRTLRGAFA